MVWSTFVLLIRSSRPALDRTLADLFRYVDEKVGLDKTLIVLSADHGGCEAPGYLMQLGFDVDYVNSKEWDKSKAIETLKSKFGVWEKLIASFESPYVYLNRKLIREKDLDLAKVEQAIADELAKFDDVALAISSSVLRTGNVPDGRIVNSVLRNFNPKRSGDIYVVFEPSRFINDFEGLIAATTHGSPWRYDTYVPIIFAGAGTPAQKLSRPVETVDVALTLSMLIGTKPPSGAAGKPLHEVVDGLQQRPKE